jgi:hypothetical protein
MSSRKRLLPLLLSLPLAAFILFLGACLPVGVGDPEASKVDPKLAAVWEEIDDDGTPKGSLVALVPFDGRAYLLRTLEVERTAEGIKVKPNDGHYKAWLTGIGGRTFLTAQPLYLKEALGDEKAPGFIVASVVVDEKSMVASAIDGEFAPLAALRKLPGHISYEPPAAGEKVLSEEDARALLRRVIAENVDKKELYSGTAKYARVTDRAILKAVFESVIG